jgi:transcriptional regulator with XRE-family HTH domain
MRVADEVSKRFGENLRRVRRQSDLSQEGLATRTELHRSEISLLERGLRVPRIDTLVKLASALKVSPGDLLDGITWKVGKPGERVPGEFVLRRPKKRPLGTLKRPKAG